MRTYLIVLSAFALFLTPLAFSPLTLDSLGFGKQIVLTIIVGLGLLGMFYNWIRDGRIRIPLSIAHLGVLAFFVFALISTLLSLDRGASLWGSGTNFPGFYAFGVLVGLYVLFLVQGESATRATRMVLFWALVGGAFLAGLIAVMQAKGVFLFPWPGTKTPAFNTVGTFNSLAVYLGGAFMLLFGAMINGYLKGIERVLGAVVGAILFAFLVAIGFKTMWIGVAVSAIVMVALTLARSHGPQVMQSVGLLTVLFAIAVFLALPRINPQLGLLSVPLEVSPTRSATLDIANKALGTRMLYGTGFGTFGWHYTKFRDASINNTNFWTLRFDQGDSAATTLFVEIGALGLLGMVLLFVGLIIASARAGLSHLKEAHEGGLIGGVLAALVFTAVLFFFYPFNLTSWLLVWGLAGLFIVTASSSSRHVTLEFSSPPLKVFVFSLMIFALITGVLYAGYSHVSRAAASYHVAQALAASESQDIIAKLMRSLQYDQRDARVFRMLAQGFMVKINEAVNRNPQAQISDFQIDVSNAINAVRRAYDLNPLDSLNALSAANVYESIIPVADGSYELALDFYQKAQALDPNNPAIPLGMARASFLESQRMTNKIIVEQQARDINKKNIGEFTNLRAELLDRAKDESEKAIGLKRDYAPAHFLLVQIYDARGESDAAVKQAEELTRTLPDDVGLKFQAGVLYFKKNDMVSARRQLEAAVVKSPDYSNAKYFLGLVYARTQERDKAIKEFVRIAELNKDNKEIPRIIENLRMGRDPLEGIVPPPETRREPPVNQDESQPQQSRTQSEDEQNGTESRQQPLPPGFEERR